MKKGYYLIRWKPRGETVEPNYTALEARNAPHATRRFFKHHPVAKKTFTEIMEVYPLEVL